MSFMKIFGNAGCVFILAVQILMSSIFVELSSQSFVVNQLCKSVIMYYVRCAVKYEGVLHTAHRTLYA